MAAEVKKEIWLRRVRAENAKLRDLATAWQAEAATWRKEAEDDQYGAVLWKPRWEGCGSLSNRSRASVGRTRRHDVRVWDCGRSRTERMAVARNSNPPVRSEMADACPSYWRPRTAALAVHTPTADDEPVPQ